MNAPASGTPQRAVAENRSCWGVILTGLDIKRDRGLDHQAFNKKIGDSCTITHGMTGEKNYIITSPQVRTDRISTTRTTCSKEFLSFDDGLTLRSQNSNLNAL